VDAPQTLRHHDRRAGPRPHLRDREARLHGPSIRNREPVQTLRNLPGKSSRLELLCLEYAGFRWIAPSVAIGLDLSAEYAEEGRKV
jgi:hypothetical protein